MAYCRKPLSFQHKDTISSMIPYDPHYRLPCVV